MATSGIYTLYVTGELQIYCYILEPDLLIPEFKDGEGGRLRTEKVSGNYRGELLVQVSDF
jgi:hypothetical protein